MSVYPLLLEYISAYNKHDINSILTFLHSDCRVIFNGQLWLQGAQAMVPSYEKDFLNPKTNVTIMKFQEDADDKNRIRVLLKTHDDQLVDVTYAFGENESKDAIIRKQMIEHIIHSVQHL